MAALHRDHLATIIAGQLMDLANQDDQLGRGEFRLESVEEDPYNDQNFVVSVSSYEDESDEPKIIRFHVRVDRLG